MRRERERESDKNGRRERGEDGKEGRKEREGRGEMGGGECEKKAGRKYKKERKIKKQIITKSQFRQREEKKKQ